METLTRHSSEVATAVDPLYIIVGIRSNFFPILGEALDTATRYRFEPMIIDIGGSVPGWRRYPNDWERAGLSDRVRKLNSKEEVLAFIEDRVDSSTTVLFLYLPDDNIRYIWRAIKRQGASVGTMVAGPVPSDDPDPTGWGKVKRWVVDTGVFVKRQFKPTPDFWATSGPICGSLYRNYFRTLRNVREIKAHSIDYETYRRRKDARGMPDHAGNYVLVLDQGWFSKPRPDFLDERQYPPADLPKFSRSMRRFLSTVESRAGLNVLVACHPKADLAATRDLYQGFEVTMEETVGLISGATLVMAHSTTAIQYAVLERRPILLFTSDELNQSIVHPLLEGYRKALNPPVVNIDGDYGVLERLTNLEISTTAYEAFECSYIKHYGSPRRPMWEIVFGSLAQLH